MCGDFASLEFPDGISEPLISSSDFYGAGIDVEEVVDARAMNTCGLARIAQLAVALRKYRDANGRHNL